MGHPDEKGQKRPLFRFTGHLERVAGLMPDGGIVSVKTDKMTFTVRDNGHIMLGAIPHIACEFVGGPLDGALFAIPCHYSNNPEAWALITDPVDG